MNRNEDYTKVIAQLPCLNSVLLHLLAMDVDDPKYFDEVLALASEDPPFAIRIMKLANASDRAPVSPIRTLHQAIPRIGLNHIAGLIATYSIADTFQFNSKSDSDLWIHSVMVAVIAKTLAPYTHDFILEPDEAYLSGLLHDIGRFIFFAQLENFPKLVDELEWTGPDQLLVAERKICGMDHATLGGYACEEWGLPQFFVDVVSKHHSYDYAASTQQDKKIGSMVRLLHASDVISMYLMQHQNWHELSAEELAEALDVKAQHPDWASYLENTDIILDCIPHILLESKVILEGLQTMDVILQRDYAMLFQPRQSDEESSV